MSGLILATASFVVEGPAAAQAPDRVRLQLLWTHQAQFAGFYVALQKGFYGNERIAVELIEGGPGINPVEALAQGRVDAAVAALPLVIDARRQGRQVVNIAQIVRQPGTAIVCRRDAGVQSGGDVSGKVIGVWNTGDQVDVRYWLRKIQVPPALVTMIEQRPNGQDLIEKRAACVTAMTYNEYWSILRSGLTPSDLFDVRLGAIGLGFLEDGIYASAAALADPSRRDTLVRFLRATLAGWSYARENVEEALAITMAMVPNADTVHQRRMLGSFLQLVGDGRKLGLLELASYVHSVDLIAGQSSHPAAVRAAAARGWTHELWRDATPDGRDLLVLPPATRYHLSAAVASNWFHALELVGTAAFAFAGFMRARQRRYDLWGAVILAMLPALGGGTLRDLLMGGERHPPFIFKDPIYLYIVVVVVAVGVLGSRFLTAEVVQSRRFEGVLDVLDTLGLATFTVVGAQIALMAGLNWLWVLFCTGLTCSGGGMLLDVVTGREPRTFQGEPYEEIAVLGAIILLAGLSVAARFEHAEWLVAGAMLVTMACVFSLRALVIRHSWRSFRLGD